MYFCLSHFQKKNFRSTLCTHIPCLYQDVSIPIYLHGWYTKVGPIKSSDILIQIFLGTYINIYILISLYNGYITSQSPN